MISDHHRDFVRAVVALAKEHGFRQISLRFGTNLADEIGARWKADRDGGRIALSAEMAETIDPGPPR
jgi:hypothetical protein